MVRRSDSIDFDSIGITDDLMFSTVFQDAELCRGLVEVLLGIEIESVEFVQEQKPLNAGPLSRAGVVDVLVRDAEGNTFDLEMQNRIDDGLPFRARRYLSLVDAMMLDHSQRFDEARGAVIVFICPCDPFDGDWKRYNFPRTCVQDGRLLGDNTDIVFVNARGTKGEVSPEFDAFARYLLDHNDIESAYVRTIDGAVRSWRNNPLWRRYRVLWSEKYRDEFVAAQRKGQEDGYKQGHEKGLAEGRSKGIAEGHEQGIAEGRQQGLAEGRQQGLAEGHKQGLAEGHEKGLAEGRQQGHQEELDRLVLLSARLDDAGRSGELVRALQDEGQLEKLFREFEIE